MTCQFGPNFPSKNTLMCFEMSFSSSCLPIATEDCAKASLSISLPCSVSVCTFCPSGMAGFADRGPGANGSTFELLRVSLEPTT
eukprot:CAMPEP_0204032146 /NCGR_PEP_ID=MMETSP0360-20130528/65875_1 /ASSEMBLY_ACC=CAM_ASM_000342 /TAXON_ID=268821 /ORGANISM="Scrippsiella Hangoei, Strain SHTV-5" /LENGTH=83 /DNA_ID=CAMNT_0050976513 /DNA_START=174 /DNA_END=422 /DNA_ORIENTATION=-